jgi:hypothetical protein
MSLFDFSDLYATESRYRPADVTFKPRPESTDDLKKKFCCVEFSHCPRLVVDLVQYKTWYTRACKRRVKDQRDPKAEGVA